MLASEKLAIAAHMHVLLRRKTGRVTDTEWMAQNAEYAAEIVRFARARAAEDDCPELAEWAAKLEGAVSQAGTGLRPPLAQAALEALRQRAAEPPSPAGDVLVARELPSQGDAAGTPRYVGGIR